ncbi:hypothetical protein HLH27_06105 [Gluconacetobacter takamatsuzukensis]|uniref:Uncharacterized protein n=1 Tax=Gluconacetobacter takamatsuzukensis TaxID=1286190 RepID=A0A7W4PQK1_9PROT|nr:hypothetical protein [Gluconacetobacter takamatsuzukensis]
MGEYQYYAFLALDRPLDAVCREALRALSSRAEITATRFAVTSDGDDFKGDPVTLVERWFDLHLYVADWGTHRLMLRFPRRLVDPRSLDAFLRPVDCAALRLSGENLILDIVREDLEPEGEGGSDWLAALAPLRADAIGGDLRFFYLLWLTAVADGTVPDDAAEPLPGIGPLSGALESFARFFGIDRDLVAAASERCGDVPADEVFAPDIAGRLVAELTAGEKDGLLARLAQGDCLVASELRLLLRRRLEAEAPGGRPVVGLRMAGELRARAHAIGEAREREEAQRAAMERTRRAAEEECARRARLDGLLTQGEAVWGEVEAEIERRNAAGYDRALGLLLDLRALAGEQGTGEDFCRRLDGIRERHARKGRFIERLPALG